jgi:hypothetical protein
MVQRYIYYHNRIKIIIIWVIFLKWIYWIETCKYVMILKPFSIFFLSLINYFSIYFITWLMFYIFVENWLYTFYNMLKPNLTSNLALLVGLISKSECSIWISYEIGAIAGPVAFNLTTENVMILVQMQEILELNYTLFKFFLQSRV